jgi:hypothetical protein
MMGRYDTTRVYMYIGNSSFFHSRIHNIKPKSYINVHIDKTPTQPKPKQTTMSDFSHLPPSLTTYNLANPVISLGAWYSGTFISSALPEYPRSSPVNTAHFSPISSAVLYVLQPTLSGQMDRSATLRPLTPWTLRRSSRTPCLTIELPLRGAMEHVPRECHVVSTWPGRVSQYVYYEG